MKPHSCLSCALIRLKIFLLHCVVFSERLSLSMLKKLVNVSSEVSFYHHPEDSLVKCSVMKVCVGLSLCAQWGCFILLDEAWKYHSYL